MGREKPGKPRRPRPPDTHRHEDFGFPDSYSDPSGRPVDHRLLGALIGASMDGCTSCADPLLTLLTEDPISTARLVELACTSMQTVLGGLPPSMTKDGVPGLSTPEFRALARAGLDGENDMMFTACAAMTPAERRAAANTALDTVVGTLVYGL